MLSESSNTVQPPPIPISAVEVVDAEQTVVIDDLRGEVKGLEQTIVTERNAVLGLRDMVMVSECVDSFLSTAMPSRSASGSVLGDCLNITR